ncbi:MAG: hypothetical protein JOZ39_13115 [Chloroflexi bacterium]|nr:hypothetical protein [Chloroflexota bacterium]
MLAARRAFRLAFAGPASYALAVCGAVAMLLLLLWSGQMLQRYPSGWELHVELAELLAVLVLAILFGLLLPLEAAALARTTRAGGAAGGALGALFGMLSVSCCAPVVVPGLLSFAGFSGTALLAFNGAVRQLALPLTCASLVLMALSVVLVTRGLDASCDVKRA